MKKVISVVLVALMLITPIISAHAYDDLDALLGGFYGRSSNNLPGKPNMPDQFSITYEYAANGRFFQVTMEKDINENYHYLQGNDEYLFLKDGRGYEVAIKTVGGFFLKSDEKNTWDYVESETETFWAFVCPTDEYSFGTITKEGEGEICNRITEKNTIEFGMGANFGGYNMSMSQNSYLEYDKETGICLASSNTEGMNVNGLDFSDDAEFNFECIRFETEDILLPELQQ